MPFSRITVVALVEPMVNCWVYQVLNAPPFTFVAPKVPKEVKLLPPSWDTSTCKVPAPAELMYSKRRNSLPVAADMFTWKSKVPVTDPP